MFGVAVRILIAEDDDTLRALLEGFLTEEGHQVSAVATSEAALRLSRAAPWDVCLVDTLGQAEHGPTVACRTFVASLAEHAPVLLCTARTWARAADAAELGVAAILPKPFDLDDLEAKLAAVRGHGHTAAARSGDGASS
jgi:two-component system, OmpR family, phosphate regulon response regulator OmpR